MSPYNYTFKRTFCCSTVIQLTNNANFSKYVLTFCTTGYVFPKVEA